VRPTSSARTAEIAKVRLGLTKADRTALEPWIATAPPLIASLLEDPGSLQWGTQEETDSASRWLAEAAGELDDPTVATSLVLGAHEITAEWRWPTHPLVQVHLDATRVAVVDYLEGSASSHWFLRWTGEPAGPHGAAELPLLPLATHVPEEAEEEAGMRAVILDAAVEAAVNKLTGRAVRLQLRDA
jgi:hypothetical protein